VPKLQVFDPAMCCSTGVCGPSVDPALAQFASDLDALQTAGVVVERFNLGQEPAAFVGNSVVAAAIRGRSDALPLLLLDDTIVSEGTYPSRDELYRLVGVSPAAGPRLALANAGCSPAAGAAPKKSC
jgi:hypothetical protein